MTDQVAEDLGLEGAATAIDALLKAQAAPPPAGDQAAAAAQNGDQQQPNSEDPADQPDSGNAAEEGAQVPAAQTTATKLVPDPAAQTRPTPEVEAKLAEAARKSAEADQARKQYLDRLDGLIPQMESAIRGEFSDIKTIDDMEKLSQSDPNRYNRLVFAQMRLQQATTARGQAAREEQARQTDQRNEWLTGEKQRVRELLPELNDPEKGPGLARKVYDFASKQGYSAEMLDNASASDFVMLHKAMQFDNLQGQQEAARIKAAKAPPVQQPGGRQALKDSKATDAFEKLQKTGRVEDAAAVFRQFIN